MLVVALCSLEHCLNAKFVSELTGTHVPTEKLKEDTNTANVYMLGLYALSDLNKLWNVMEKPGTEETCVVFLSAVPFPGVWNDTEGKEYMTHVIFPYLLISHVCIWTHPVSSLGSTQLPAIEHFLDAIKRVRETVNSRVEHPWKLVLGDLLICSKLHFEQCWRDAQETVQTRDGHYSGSGSSEISFDMMKYRQEIPQSPDRVPSLSDSDFLWLLPPFSGSCPGYKAGLTYIARQLISLLPNLSSTCKTGALAAVRFLVQNWDSESLEVLALKSRRQSDVGIYATNLMRQTSEIVTNALWEIRYRFASLEFRLKRPLKTPKDSQMCADDIISEAINQIRATITRSEHIPLARVFDECLIGVEKALSNEVKLEKENYLNVLHSRQENYAINAIRALGAEFYVQGEIRKAMDIGKLIDRKRHEFVQWMESTSADVLAEMQDHFRMPDDIYQKCCREVAAIKDRVHEMLRS